MASTCHIGIIDIECGDTKISLHAGGVTEAVKSLLFLT